MTSPAWHATKWIGFVILAVCGIGAYMLAIALIGSYVNGPLAVFLLLASVIGIAWYLIFLDEKERQAEHTASVETTHGRGET